VKEYPVRYTEDRLRAEEEITRLLFITDGIGDMCRHLQGATTPGSGRCDDGNWRGAGAQRAVPSAGRGGSDR
jgi:hypothetical protein